MPFYRRVCFALQRQSVLLVVGYEVSHFFRYYEPVDGKRVHRNLRIGSVRELPHRRDAEKAVLSLRSNINNGVRSPETASCHRRSCSSQKKAISNSAGPLRRGRVRDPLPAAPWAVQAFRFVKVASVIDDSCDPLAAVTLTRSESPPSDRSAPPAAPATAKPHSQSPPAPSPTPTAPTDAAPIENTFVFAPTPSARAQSVPC